FRKLLLIGWIADTQSNGPPAGRHCRANYFLAERQSWSRLSRLAARPAEPPLQFPHLLKALGHVAHDGHGARDSLRPISQQHDGELDRNPRALPGQAGYRQQVAVAIAARTRLHCLAKSAPVPGTQVFGNDQVERLAGGLGGRRSEERRVGKECRCRWAAYE